jgi:hypothetical protein
MNEEQYNALIEATKKWLKTHPGRTRDEIEAFVDGIEEALFVVYSDTRHGAYPSNTARAKIEEFLYPDDEG